LFFIGCDQAYELIVVMEEQEMKLAIYGDAEMAGRFVN